MSEKNMINADIRYIKGIGQQRAGLLNKLGIFFLRDLLSYFPRDYEDRTKISAIFELVPGGMACVHAMIAEPCRLSHIRKGMDIVKGRAVDEKGSLELVFFNQKYVKDALIQGKSYVFYGRVSGSLLRPEMQNPVFEHAPADGNITGRIVPVYRLCAGLSQNVLSRLVRQALLLCLDELPDALSAQLRDKYALADARFAYESIHFPQSFEALARAKHRLVFEELLLLSLGLMRLKTRSAGAQGLKFKPVGLDAFYRALSFALTNAQQRAIKDVAEDMTSGRPMNRLLQGDVGSGKTVVAAASAYFAAQNGYQTALMAPTGILAEQHFASLEPLFSALGLRTALLTGDTKDKNTVKTALMQGEIDVLIGTHALLTDDVAFKNLGLAITDEQHRFGVRQRAALAHKSAGAHVLVMSATPIPRTLALILYGDLYVSVMDEIPPGRQKVDTFVVDESMRARIEIFVRRLVGEGRQVYIVCPLVEEDETDDGRKAVESYSKHLQQEVYPDLRVHFVHGRMKAADKDAVMRRFAAGQIDILVSTTVIEVGVDVPNAALMVVENAERYGLSQLHQLRGRVGRGAHKSYCVLFSQSEGDTSRQRLSTMARTNDGFEIAEEDLRLRGPGDFFGSRQHGLPQLKIADLSYDVEILRQAQQAAAQVLSEDARLSLAEHEELRQRVLEMFENCAGGNIFN